MSLRFINPQLLFHPEPIGGDTGKASRESILDSLNKAGADRDANDAPDDDNDDLNLDLGDDNDKAGDEKDKEGTESTSSDTDDDEGKDKDKEEDKEEKDELAELEEELKEPKEEDLELTTPVKKREILAKYPKIFEEFPSLEKSYYRELEYTKLLPTIQDARDAVTAVKTLEAFESDLREGNTVELFKAIAQEDPNGFAKLADKYMENLAATDEKAYHHVLGNITKDIVTAMVNAGKKAGNKELQESATTLYQFMFGDIEWKPKQRLSIDNSTEENKEREALNKEKADFEKTKFTERQGELMTGVNNRIKSVIDINIDKKEEMTPYVRAKAVEDVQTKLDKLMKADSRFQSIVNRLWDNAKKEKYSRESLQRIESAHTHKAKSLLPTVILSVKKEALKGVNSRKRTTKDNKNTETNDTDTNTSRNSAASRDRADDTRNLDKSKPLPGESTLDFLTRRGK